MKCTKVLNLASYPETFFILFTTEYRQDISHVMRKMIIDNSVALFNEREKADDSVFLFNQSFAV